jgi:hypothetical protein
MAAATWTKSGLTSTGRWLLASTGYPVDEVTNIENDVEYDYYCSIYSHIKSHMQNKIAVMNPGHYKVTERIMSL